MADDRAVAGRLDGITSFVGAWVDENPERAAALLVSRHGDVLIERGFGVMHTLSNPAVTVPVQPDTIFLVASITKPLTAAALCLLVDRRLGETGRPGGRLPSGLLRRRARPC